MVNHAHMHQKSGPGRHDLCVTQRRSAPVYLAACSGHSNPSASQRPWHLTTCTSVITFREREEIVVL